jgi:dolichol-phosphate mannosyltransferase
VGLGGLQLFALGLVGQYVWRGLEESRRRPPYLIESMVGDREIVRLR